MHAWIFEPHCNTRQPPRGRKLTLYENPLRNCQKCLLTPFCALVEGTPGVPVLGIGGLAVFLFTGFLCAGAEGLVGSLPEDVSVFPGLGDDVPAGVVGIEAELTLPDGVENTPDAAAVIAPANELGLRRITRFFIFLNPGAA